MSWEKKTRTDLFVQEDRKVMEDMLRGRTGSGEDKIQYAELRLKIYPASITGSDVIIRPLPLMQGTVAKVVGRTGWTFRGREAGSRSFGNRLCGTCLRNLQQGR